MKQRAAHARPSLPAPRDVAAELARRWRQFDWGQGLRRLAFAVTCGAAAGLACAGLCLCVDKCNALWQEHRWLLWCLPALAVASIFLYDKLGLRTDVRSFTGPNRIVRNMTDNVPVPARMGPAMLAGTCLSLAGGASVGPDAAAKQLGASLGDLVARPFGLWEEKDGQRVPLFGFACATGLAACFSALLIAPLGVFAYTVELARHDGARLRHWPSMLVACGVACLVARPFGLSFVSPFVPRFPYDLFTWEAVAAVAVLAAVVGTLHRAGIKALDLWVRLRLGSPYLSVLVGSLAILAIYQLVPFSQHYGGVGTELLHAAFHDHIGPWAFLAKLGMTVLALGFGLRGGEVTPLFVIGSLLGCSLGTWVGGDVRPLAALGLVTLFGVCCRAPVGAVLMGCEFFGYQAAGHLAVAMALAWALSSWLLGILGGFIARRAADRAHSLNAHLWHEAVRTLHRNDHLRRHVLRALRTQPAVRDQLVKRLQDFEQGLCAAAPHDHTARAGRRA